MWFLMNEEYLLKIINYDFLNNKTKMTDKSIFYVKQIENYP